MKQSRVSLVLLGAIAVSGGCERGLPPTQPPAADVALPSSSPDPGARRSHAQARPPSLARAPANSDVITFSEFPLGTAVTDQYADKGITFGGSGPFITQDGANPTSPVLSGTPRFQGNITGSFVVPGTDRRTIVESFTLDAGYFDEIGSTRIEWFDPDGKKLGQKINSRFGIETITIEGGNIASWKIGIVESEPAGFAIDNVSSKPVEAAVLFREKDDGKVWLPLGNEIPGIDHTGILIGDTVYESHPPQSGTYISADGSESVVIVADDGVQWQFTLATFAHDSKTRESDVIGFEKVPVRADLAQKMKAEIRSVGDAGFNYLSGFGSMSPATQKGADGRFTCVGLLEWAAEKAGHNGGQGFIPNAMEGIGPLPLLSPSLLNYAMKTQQLLHGAKQWLKGFFDPVDFVIVDPLGRRLGFVQGAGSYNEIPHSFYSGDAAIEEVLIPAAIPGPYTIRLTGRGAEALAALEASGAATGFSGFLAAGATVERVINVPVVPGGPGDLDGDGSVDADDLAALQGMLDRFTPGLGHAGDLDGDGLLSAPDVQLLSRLVQVLSVAEIGIDVHPGSDTNPVNPRAQGVVPVAVLGSRRFDVTTIDPRSLAFGPGKAREAHDLTKQAVFLDHTRDLNGDGIVDLIGHFRQAETGLSAQDAQACVTGSTTTGVAFKGCDKVTVQAR